MPDSPKCLACFFEDETKGQTYKIAGKNAFKCADCKNIYAGELFQEIEFKWQDKKEEWESFMREKKKTFKPKPKEARIAS